MARSRSPSLACARATRRNTACDRRAGSGSVNCWRVAIKRGGAGRANWGKPGDELFDDISDFDCTQASHLEDAYNMEALEQVVLPPALDLLPPPAVHPPQSFISEPF